MISILKYAKNTRFALTPIRYFTNETNTEGQVVKEQISSSQKESLNRDSGNKGKTLLKVGILGVGLIVASYFGYKTFKALFQLSAKEDPITDIMAKEIPVEDISDAPNKEEVIVKPKISSFDIDLHSIDRAFKPHFENVNKLTLKEKEQLASILQKELNKLSDDFSFFIKVREFSSIRVKAENVFSLEAFEIINLPLIERQLTSTKGMIKGRLAKEIINPMLEELVTSYYINRLIDGIL